jgi:hypothetical protein
MRAEQCFASQKWRVLGETMNFQKCRAQAAIYGGAGEMRRTAAAERGLNPARERLEGR